MQNTPPVCSILHRAPFSLAAPAKKKKKKAFCLFSNTSLSCGWGGRAWTCSWQPRLQRASLAGPACRQRGRGAGCRIRSHYAICFSHLLLFSTGVCSRGLCACVYVSSGALSCGGEGGGRPSLPAFPETPNLNGNEILNDCKVSALSRTFSWGEGAGCHLLKIIPVSVWEKM